MKVSDFDYELPEASIAQHAVEPRDAARLLVVERATNTRHHRHVRDLVQCLCAGDLLVTNDTRVLPARLHGRRKSGGRVELLVLDAAPLPSAHSCRAFVKPAGRLREGETFELEGGALIARALVRARATDGSLGAEWALEITDPAQPETSIRELLERFGRMPLPPYIRREADRDPHRETDRERYQTIFARESGAVAAPTAGLHFTERLLAELAEHGIERASITLHVGPGTFRPVQVDEVEAHVMHAEPYVLPAATVDAVARARERGGRVVAVGTTSARVLEACAGDSDSCARARGGSRAPARAELVAGRGETALFIRPGYEFRIVDALLTNFHLPRSTLLMLVSALVGRERVLALYREAVESGYRFYSYGDAMLIV